MSEHAVIWRESTSEPIAYGHPDVLRKHADALNAESERLFGATLTKPYRVIPFGALCFVERDVMRVGLV